MTAKIIDSGISSKHAPKWTVGEAVREVLQNYLDVRSEFQAGGSITWSDGIATVRDSGPGMQMKHLAFGENDKVAGSIGQFGEGLKSAMVVLAREERKIEIKTSGLIIRPVIRVSENFQTETLHFRISKMTPRLSARLKGTHIRIQCSEAELEKGRNYFVQLKQTKAQGGKFNWLERNRISLPGGNVYVNGSVVGTIDNAMFSYHLSGINADQIVNRDRNAVNMNMVTELVSSILIGTSSTKVMKALLEDRAEQGACWESNLPLYIGDNNPQVWMRVWNELYGKRVAISSDHSSDKEAAYRGYKLLGVDYDSRRFFRSFGVKSSEDLLRQISAKASKPRLNKVSARNLTDPERENFLWAKRMIRRHYTDPTKIVIVNDLNGLLGAVDFADFQGAYNPSNQTVYITRKTLSNRAETLHVLLHEFVHKVSGHSDLTPEFQIALLNVAVNMMERKGL